MEQKIEHHHYHDNDNNPTGGYSTGTGISIRWQDGPLGRGADRKEPDGAFVEGVIQAAIGRLEFYQASKFHCMYNSEAIRHLQLALSTLNDRTRTRESREVEGTHQV